MHSLNQLELARTVEDDLLRRARDVRSKAAGPPARPPDASSRSSLHGRVVAYLSMSLSRATAHSPRRAK